MFDEPSSPLEDLPTDPYERALSLQLGLTAHATDGSIDPEVYRVLRKEFLADPGTAPLVPRFVRTCRDTSQLWEFAKSIAPQWAPRRAFIAEAFQPLLDYLEKRSTVAVELISETLLTFDAGGVHRAWEKALQRSGRDPEGAITAARTLLESVCKHILDEGVEPGTRYGSGEDLPKLFRATGESLNLAPSQHTEEVFKRILGGCSSVVEGLGSLRNKVGDAHGQGKRPVRVLPRHAHLAVNLAGAMATFLVETAEARSGAK